jgi:hypothetical protein
MPANSCPGIEGVARHDRQGEVHVGERLNVVRNRRTLLIVDVHRRVHVGVRRTIGRVPADHSVENMEPQFKRAVCLPLENVNSDPT